MTLVIPVVAAYSVVWQAGVTRDIDAIGISIQLSGAATAASVGDVTAQHHHNTLQRCGAVQDWLWSILGRQRVLEVEGSDLDSELHVPY